MRLFPEPEIFFWILIIAKKNRSSDGRDQPLPPIGPDTHSTKHFCNQKSGTGLGIKTIMRLPHGLLSAQPMRSQFSDSLRIGTWI